MFLERIMLWLLILLEDLKNCAACILRSKRASWEIPDNIIKEIARCLLPDIIAYCESDAGKEAFAKSQAEQNEKGRLL